MRSLGLTLIQHDSTPSKVRYRDAGQEKRGSEIRLRQQELQELLSNTRAQKDPTLPTI
jgi:hypothetical protein